MIPQRVISKPLLALFVLAALAHLGVAPLDITAARSAEPDGDAAARSQILESPAWRQAMEGFNEWLSAQAIYDKSEIPRVRARITDKISKMSIGQLQNYLQDMQQKLAIINSKAAFDAQAIVLDDLNVASNAYAAKLRKELPDLATMTAGQVQQTLLGLQQQQTETRANEAAFQSSREQELATVKAWNQQTADANAAADAAMSAGGGNYSGGLYAPRPYQPPVYNPAPIIVGWPWPW
ncbi:MAG TPA: hypothetical protein VG056_08095 [Pirellulales bacterium]|jgi:hypothetical protein|nr:hypothetical protein [Pirellulales bacterium]